MATTTTIHGPRDHRYTSGAIARRLILFRAGPVKVMLHWLRTPDEPELPHDHPWSFLSVVLRGSYVELVDGQEVTHRHVVAHRASTEHAVVSAEPGTLTLLVSWRPREEA